MDAVDHLLQQIKKGLPIGWESLPAEQQLHYLLLSADEVLQPKGDFILLNASLTMRELLTPDQADGASPQR